VKERFCEGEKLAKVILDGKCIARLPLPKKRAHCKSVSANNLLADTLLGTSLFLLLVAGRCNRCYGLGLRLLRGLGDNGFLGRASETEKGTDHAEESEESSGESDTSLRLSLESTDGVFLGGGDEVESFGAEESNGVFLEGRSSLILVLRLSSLIVDLLNNLLDIERLLGEGLSILKRVTDVDVIEEDILSHGPELDTNTTNLGQALNRLVVLEEVGVGDLGGCPFAFVGRVVDHGREPLALVSGVGLVGTFPFTASRCLSALGVGNGGWDVFTIFLIVPLFRLGGIGVGDSEGFVVEPALGLGGLLIDNLVRCILVPVLRLGGIRVSNLLLVNPVGGLLVLRIVDLLGWGGARSPREESQSCQTRR